MKPLISGSPQPFVVGQDVTIFVRRLICQPCPQSVSGIHEHYVGLIATLSDHHLRIRVGSGYDMDAPGRECSEMRIQMLHNISHNGNNVLRNRVSPITGDDINVHFFISVTSNYCEPLKPLKWRFVPLSRETLPSLVPKLLFGNALRETPVSRPAPARDAKRSFADPRAQTGVPYYRARKARDHPPVGGLRGGTNPSRRPIHSGRPLPVRPGRHAPAG